jgi:predicted nucleotidyltransferase
VLAFGDAWMPNYRPGILERAAELRERAERPIEIQLMGVPADPVHLERAEQAGVRRVLHWLPSTGRGPIERALERWESAIAELHGE